MTQTETIEREDASLRPPRERIPVAILGATGSVGQRFIQLLETHPWFRVHELVASERSAGKSYAEATQWRLETSIPHDVAAKEIAELGSNLESTLLFSGLDSSVAGKAEEDYADRGAVVISNSKNHRMDPDVPLLIPELNADHVGAIEKQRARRGGQGYIVTNPNCSTVGIAMAIAPIERLFGIESIDVTTMQAISGAGYNGVASYSILDNIIPWISDEEGKIESEPRKILGTWDGEKFSDAPFVISAQVNRVAVIDGHLASISLRLRDRDVLRKSSSIEKIVQRIREAIVAFRGEPQELGLPTAPKQPLHLLDDDDRPQPRLDRDRERGMAVSIGRVRPCSVNDIRMVALVHNTIRGAAGAAILNAELLRARGLL